VTRESLASQRLWLAFATMLLVAGITNTFPVFLPAPNSAGSRAATAATASLLWVGGALLSPVAGYLVARWNPRRLVSLGLGLVALGMLLGSWLRRSPSSWSPWGWGAASASA
jgi:MFS family permease